LYVGKYLLNNVPIVQNVTVTTFAGNYFGTPTTSYSTCSDCVPPPENLKINWFFSNQLQSYAPNVTNPNLTITSATPSSIVKVNTNSFGSGTFNSNFGFIPIKTSFVYVNNVGSINNLRISIGSANDATLYGELVISQPGVGQTYQLETNPYFTSSGPSTYNIYVTITTF
jgi:hypothetical protein